jgi:tRNA U54 and U55 pseudouridine synthase Pus10
MTDTVKKPRKRRTDRNHIIYLITVGEAQYVGVTYKEKTVLHSLQRRAHKHYYRATVEGKQWLLCQALRTLTSKHEIDIRPLEIVRGKAAAHARETELRALMRPELNTDRRGSGY